jgi:hypothetical protein
MGPHYSLKICADLCHLLVAHTFPNFCAAFAGMSCKNKYLQRSYDWSETGKNFCNESDVFEKYTNTKDGNFKGNKYWKPKERDFKK